MAEPSRDGRWLAFRATLVARGRSAGTIGTYERVIDSVRAYHPGRDIGRLDRRDIERYLAAGAATVRPGTLGFRFRHLRDFYDWLTSVGEIDRSPMDGVPHPVVAGPPTHVLDDAAVEALVATCDRDTFEDRRDAAILRLFREPGAPSATSMAGILLPDVRGRQVRFRDKRHRIRDIPCGEATGLALAGYLTVRAGHRLADAHPQVWLTRLGPMTPWAIRLMVGRRANRAGLGHVQPCQLRPAAGPPQHTSRR